MDFSFNLFQKGKVPFLFLFLVSISCSFRDKDSPSIRKHIPSTQKALYWILASNQYPALTTSLYKLARIKIKENLENLRLSAFPEQEGNFCNLSPAVILDIDETVLANTTYIAYLIRTGRGYSPDTWAKYVKSGISGEVPGAVDFIKWVISEGVKVFFVTNRTENFKEETLRNLKKIGINFPQMREHSFFRASHGEFGLLNKYPRYREISKKHRILLMIGDDFSDFVYTQGLNAQQYKALFSKYEGWLGERWIILPNPFYGDWEQIQDLGDRLPVWSAY